MRVLIVLCLAAAATAQYAYHQGEGGSGGAGGGPSGGFGGPSYGGNGGGDGTKEFYSFSAPEEEFDQGEGSEQLANSQKNNLRVIFIKGPENNGLENAALALAKNAAEQKTAIYVLHKQTDLSDLQNKFDQVRNDNNHKPEVHFVKYRTPEDAYTAQRTIQSQYDPSGHNQLVNGGVGQVLNFASQGPSRGHGGSPAGNGGGFGGSIGNNVNQNYLPPSLRFRRFRI